MGLSQQAPYFPAWHHWQGAARCPPAKLAKAIISIWAAACFWSSAGQGTAFAWKLMLAKLARDPHIHSHFCSSYWQWFVSLTPLCSVVSKADMLWWISGCCNRGMLLTSSHVGLYALRGGFWYSQRGVFWSESSLCSWLYFSLAEPQFSYLF